jgi:hypothetical protein
MTLEVGEYHRFPISNLLCINAVTTVHWFCLEIGCVLSRALEGKDAVCFLRIFLLDSRTLNKIIIAAALRLQTSQAMGN